MGKNIFLIISVAILNTIVFVVVLLSIIGSFAPYCDPRKFTIIPLIGLVLPAIILVNCFVLFYWKPIPLLIALVALGLNYDNIKSIFRLPLFSKIKEVKTVDGSQRVRIATYNVSNFIYNRSENSLDSITAFVEKEHIDILCLQEYKAHTRNGVPDSLHQIFKSLPYKVVVGEAGPRLRTAIFSKYPITYFQEVLFAESNNTAIYANIDVEGTMMRVVSVHLQTTDLNRVRKKKRISGNSFSEKTTYLSDIIHQTNLNFSTRATQADMIRSIVETSPHPAIVGGDFNDTPSSFVYKRVKGNLNDGFDHSGKYFGYTFHGFFRILRIDYILYSKQLTPHYFSTPTLPWSDHNPVILELALPE